MSGPRANSSRGESVDYFSRRVSRHGPWTEDLVTIDTDDEDRSEDGMRSTALLSPVQSHLLTPATLSPPVESTETSPLLDSRSLNYQRASDSTPVVCCRAGGRPAERPSNVDAPFFPSGPPQNMGGQPGWYRAEPDLERNKHSPRRRGDQSRRRCGSKYLHRWILALGLLATLVLIRGILCGDWLDTSDTRNAHSSLPYRTQTFTHAFDKVEAFSFVDELQSHLLDIRGTLSLKSAQQGQEADIVATVSYSTSTDAELTALNWKLTASSLHLRLPDFEPSLASRSRLSVAVTLHLQSSVSLRSLNIESTHLAIEASSDLFGPGSTSPIPSINTTTMTTRSTPIHLACWTGRRTILKTSSGHIRGAFTLLDMLAISSQSGSVDISVNSGEADASHPEPAQMRIHTASGSVRVASGTTSVHEREYRTEIDTQSGSITGTYLLGSAASFTTSSGTISADILPYDSQALGSESSLRTRTSSGATNVEVLRAYRNSDKTVKGLHSSHVSSGSGSLKLRYPSQWEGKIAATVGSGSISVKGQGVVIDEMRDVYGRHVLAHKGDGDCRLEAQTGSASVDVLVGSW